MTQTPTLTGQDIGQAHHATRAVLERMLAGTGTGFHHWVTLNAVGGNGLTLDEEALVARVVHGLKITETEAREILAEILDQGLVARTGVAGAAAQLSLTTAGRARFDQVTAALAQITERLYGGLPAEELAAAHRILATVTARANAELSG